jgi:CDP-glycerol glycerophosphotransferase (TagB/SpsB family)/glycosyltransferase involved in cell wall biosynthesis
LPTSARLTKIKGQAKDELLARARRRPIREGVVVYESNSGKGASCNPEAIFRALLAAPDMDHLRHVWVLEDTDPTTPFCGEFAKHPRVSFVRYQSYQYFAELATAQYLVNNSTFPPEFGKREGQVYVNTWHGTPLKKMGYDVEGGGPDTRNIIRNFAAADYVLSPNAFTSRTMLRHAYRLDGVYRGAIIEEGYPRVDRQVLDAAEADRLRDRLAQEGVRLAAGQRVALYAPTWKGDFYAPTNDIALLVDLVERLDERFEGSDWKALLKVHQRVYDFAKDEPALAGRLIPNDIPPNLVLGLADALVTDYSSIFYDFQATGRPILFYIPDLAAYEGSRGLYQQPESWPGPITVTVDDLADRILAIGVGSELDPVVTHGEALAEAREQYNAHDDGNASERVVDIVFRGHEEGYEVQRDFGVEKKKRLLIYAGGMLANGITTSLLNLLDTIDYETFDVSVAYQHTRNPDIVANIARINSKVRLFPRIGRFVVPRRKDRLLGRPGFPWGASPVGPWAEQAFHEEWRRCYGDLEFDHIIDFSGYSPQWAGVLAAGPADRRAIWLHHDLANEVEKEVRGRRPHEKTLPQVFQLYRRYAHIVSVSAALARVNHEKLGAYAPGAAFTHARNLIRPPAILGAAHGPRPETQLDDLPADRPMTLAESVALLVHTFGADDVLTEAVRRDLVDRTVETVPGFRFVSVGRLSPEKNHARLLRAFAKVHAARPETGLVVVGTGELGNELVALAAMLGIAHAVNFTGQLANPYAVMDACDCFVLSSDYEGQPMVLLEALVLGLPIVTTRFGSVGDALPPGAGVVVDQDDSALSQAMLAAIDGRVKAPPFDGEQYNLTVMDEFLQAIGAR